MMQGGGLNRLWSGGCEFSGPPARAGATSYAEQMATNNNDHAAWWAALTPEQRYSAIEMVRLNQDPDHTSPLERPTGDQADFVRGTPEYLERFAGADRIARVDETGIGPSIVPEAHDDTEPLKGGSW